MMLNERQKQIFLCLDENKNSFIKGIELANKVNCSLKTLQNTVKEMKIILEKYQLEIISMTSKGYNLIIILLKRMIWLVKCMFHDPVFQVI